MRNSYVKNQFSPNIGDGGDFTYEIKMDEKKNKY